jgi:hypothetical protein
MKEIDLFFLRQFPTNPILKNEVKNKSIRKSRPNKQHELTL